MRDMSQAVLGMLAAFISAVLVFGGLTISMAEGGLQAALAPEQSPTITQPLPTQKPGEPTYTPSPTPLPTATPTLIISDLCDYPPEWVEVTVDFGDDIASLAARYGLSVDGLRQSNCLDMRALMAGMTIYVPPITPTATTTPSATPGITPAIPNPTRSAYCPRPYGWVIYYVKGGDTLFRISSDRGISVQELKNRNCLVSNLIRPGQRLYVPNVPVPLPTSTPPPPQPTSTGIPPTLAQPSATPVISTATSIPPSSTAVVLPTNTAQPPTSTSTPPPSTPTVPAPTTAPTATPVPITRTPAPLPSATSTRVPPPEITRPPIITITVEVIIRTPFP